jgi:non-homologous end joining protein Ku
MKDLRKKLRELCVIGLETIILQAENIKVKTRKKYHALVSKKLRYVVLIRDSHAKFKIWTTNMIERPTTKISRHFLHPKKGRNLLSVRESNPGHPRDRRGY